MSLFDWSNIADDSNRDDIDVNADHDLCELCTGSGTITDIDGYEIVCPGCDGSGSQR